MGEFFAYHNAIKENGKGVYCLVDIRYMIAYVGSTDDFRRRSHQHEELLKNGKHFNEIINAQKDKGRFYFLPIDYVQDDMSREELRSLEDIYTYAFSKIDGYVVANRQCRSMKSYDAKMMFCRRSCEIAKHNIDVAFWNQFGWKVSEQYKNRIERIRNQKEMVFTKVI